MILLGSHKTGLRPRVTTVLWSAGKALGMGQGKWSREGDPMGPTAWTRARLYRSSARTVGEELLEAQAPLVASMWEQRPVQLTTLVLGRVDIPPPGLSLCPGVSPAILFSHE